MKKAGIFLVCIMLCIGFMACGKEKTVTTGEKESELSPTAVVDENEGIYDIRGNGTVVWTIFNEGEIRVNESNINALNKKLLEDGYSCTLSIRYVLRKNDYYSILAELLAKGETDIASMDCGRTGDSVNLLADGTVEELSGYLSTEEGQILWNSFFEEKWKGVTIDDKIYFIPNQVLNEVSGYYGFNREFFTEEEVSFFSGEYDDFRQLKELLMQKEFPEGVHPVYWWNSVKRNARIAGYNYYYGTFVELVTGLAKNPYETEEYKELLYELHDMYQMGLLTELESREEQDKVVLERNFGMWQALEMIDLVEQVRDDVIYVPIPYFFSTSRSRNVSVCKTAPHKKEALQLLTLLHSNPEYANLLIFGEEGKDYQLIDGYACNMDGSARSDIWKCCFMGIFNFIHPTQESYFTVDRMKVKNELYNSPQKKENPILGFEADSSKFDEQMLALESVVQEYQYLWMEEDFEAAWAEASEAYVNAGGQRVIDEMNRQIQEWMKE